MYDLKQFLCCVSLSVEQSATKVFEVIKMILRHLRSYYVTINWENLNPFYLFTVWVILTIKQKIRMLNFFRGLLSNFCTARIPVQIHYTGSFLTHKYETQSHQTFHSRQNTYKANLCVRRLSAPMKHLARDKLQVSTVRAISWQDVPALRTQLYLLS